MMMNKQFTFACILTSFCFFGAATAHALTPTEIMNKANSLDMGDKVTSHITMTVTNPNGSKSVHELASYRKKFGSPKNEDRVIMFYTAPSTLKNVGFLSIDKKDPAKADQRWMYSPAIRKVKKVATKDKRLAFMNSDFSYADMSIRDAENFDFTSMKEDMLDGQKVWVIEGTPVNEKEVGDDGYSKSVFYVRQDNFLIVRALNYLRTGNKVKQMDITNVQKVDGFLVLGEITMVTRKVGTELSRTTLKTSDVKFNQPLEDNFFTEHQLQKGL